jgi:hypothetical protein
MCQIYMCTMLSVHTVNVWLSVHTVNVWLSVHTVNVLLSVHTVNVLLYVIFCECVACKDFFPNYIQSTVLILLYIICCVSNVHVV